jgi:Flp pilus assembly protein TadD
MSASSAAKKWTTPRRLALLAVVLVLLSIGLGFAGLHLYRWFAPRPTDVSAAKDSSDPRRAYDGPYRNIHPDVRYVGDAQCTACHADIARTYSHHPMGRSLVPIEALVDGQRYSPDVNNPFSALGRRFEVERQGKQMWHRQAVLDDSGKPVVDLSLEAHWVIGSGSKGYSYLCKRDGYLLQSPISWYGQKQRWDLSPGFGPDVLAGRLIPAGCLFCHANRVHERPQQQDRFVEPVFEGQSIGCERCHGPGERHVQSADPWDIVNPAHLTPKLRDAVCEQCHLEGEARLVRAGRQLFDYRPGLPLNDFWAVLVQVRQSGEDTKAVNHVEQMYQSKCFSHPVEDLQLGCISCHDPHVYIGPDQRLTYYRGKCLLCHDGAKPSPVCSEPLERRRQVSPQDSCIECHMPRYRSSDIAHTASTDHRIVRRPAMTGDSPPDHADLDSAVLMDFYRDRFPEGDPQTERTLGLGTLRLIAMNRLSHQKHADRALRFLEVALGRDPSDGSVREGKVHAYLLLNRQAEALSEAETLLPEQPGNWQLWTQAAYAAESLGQMDRACDYWRRAVENNPFRADYQIHLLTLLIRAGRLEEAQKHCEQLLQLDPFNVSGRQALVGLLLQKGQRAEAQRAFDIIRRLKPPDLARREELFRQQLSEPRP